MLTRYHDMTFLDNSACLHDPHPPKNHMHSSALSAAALIAVGTLMQEIPYMPGGPRHLQKCGTQVGSFCNLPTGRVSLDDVNFYIHNDFYSHFTSTPVDLM